MTNQTEKNLKLRYEAEGRISAIMNDLQTQTGLSAVINIDSNPAREYSTIEIDLSLEDKPPAWTPEHSEPNP